MEFKGPSVYDQDDFFACYMKRRGRKESPNNAIEGPIIFELLGSYRGLSILDLGCGDASFGKELLLQGAESYVGLEGSVQMRKEALKNLQGVNGNVIAGVMESYEYPTDTYDLVTSRFAIHYVSDIEKLFQQIYNTLKEGGRFVFSVQHPVTTSSFKSKQSGDKREDWVVDDYFRESERSEPWLSQSVVKYHRTIESYFRSLVNAGFQITDLREGAPVRARFEEESEYQRRLKIPLVLAFSCIK